MVDCPVLESGKPLNIGKIYSGKGGERLLNVAVSRARHKLIVVCDPDYIKNIPGNTITNNSRSLFHKLSKYEVNIVPRDKDSREDEDDYEWYFVDDVPFTKTSKTFLSYDCRVVLSTLGYYLEVTGEYIKLGDYLDGFSCDEGNVWVKKPVNEKGYRMIHDINGDSHLIGYLREEEDKIVYTTPDDMEFKITFNEE